VSVGVDGDARRWCWLGLKFLMVTRMDRHPSISWETTDREPLKGEAYPMVKILS
jgi:hypothetical protein